MTRPVVLFDLDDTVFAHRESVEAGIAAHRTTLGGALAAADRANEFARWNALEELHYHRYLTGELDFLQQRRERARGFLKPYGVQLDDAAADEWFDRYLVHYESTWTLHADTLPCLEALRPARFGVITNGSLPFQAAKIDGVGLSPWIEHVIASGEVGIAKPDPRIFHIACGVFEVEPAEAVYVGDRLHTDAIGAARAGLLGVWLDRPGVATRAELAEAAAEGVPVIRSLAELPALLG
ncbi:MAG TPA: HAD family hydrolase [Pseudolysinimonas sp.]|jgi:putative hydrolase of the HAD superfamily|nr:HAD family hydrolase [Pseudolysinimonas sp.]